MNCHKLNVHVISTQDHDIDGDQLPELPAHALAVTTPNPKGNHYPHTITD